MRIIAIRKIGRGGKAFYSPPPLTNFNILPKYRTYGFKVLWAWRYTRWPIFEKNIFAARNFYPFLYPFEIKKSLNLGKKSETIPQMGEKQKTFFFWKLYQNAKNPVAFDFWSKDLIGHKLSFFSNKYPFFCPFWPNIQKPFFSCFFMS